MHFLFLSILPYILIIGLPLAGAIVNELFFRTEPIRGARLTTAAVWSGGLLAVLALIDTTLNPGRVNVAGFQGDALAWLMATLVLLVSGIIHQFSLRYMAGDRAYHRYYVNLSLVTASALLLVTADHLLLLLVGWGLSNGLLVRLIVHKSTWKASVESGKLAMKTFVAGFLCLSVAVALLWQVSGTVYLHQLVQIELTAASSWPVTVALLLIIIGAMTQSAQWPFQRWLISSLNSPTPVSALMHAGLVSGGGLLLARFAPLYLARPELLQVLLVVGGLTAVTGTAWKLIQNDIKRMLACSTIGQMGFMFMQCGLGLFPAAIAHICWHGLFKAFLFLNTGSAVEGNRKPTPVQSGGWPVWLLAGCCGLAGAYSFATMSHLAVAVADTTLLLTGFAFIAATQTAYTVLQSGSLTSRIIPAIALTLLAGALYGLSVRTIESLLTPLAIWSPQPLTALHLIVFGVFSLTWLPIPLKLPVTGQTSRVWQRLYVRALNGSQPHPRTTTPTRNSYHY
ncbi:proton-conducting transporter transmembrane domain-containing protein [Hymenobacter nivis]|uniref:proton-conducting transporter transmembrane domain-containing protein n=1 Tax=Hymenobacter nivis TaxID=1850093 RepID=UPI001474B232|nr:proton-conducting transporter membrane subunit [Hymenobacter nivis]